MCKWCLEKEKAKESHMWHRMSPSKFFLMPHRMPKSPWLVFFRPKCLHGDMVKALIQAILEAIKGNGSKCTIHFQWPIKSYSLYWSRIMGFLSSPQRLEDLHIQKGTMLMPNVNTMVELEGIPWRITRPSKTRFNPWSTQIQPNSKSWSMDIKSVKIKDQLGVVFLLLFMNVFIFECIFERCKQYFDVSICMKWMDLCFGYFCHFEFCWCF